MVVRVLTEHGARRPAKARTHISDELISVVVQDALTAAERALVSNGENDVVLSARRAFHATLRADLVAGVEQLTNRTVIAFFSEDTIDPEIALASFLLAPKDIASMQTSKALVALSQVDPTPRR